MSEVWSKAKRVQVINANGAECHYWILWDSWDRSYRKRTCRHWYFILDRWPHVNCSVLDYNLDWYRLYCYTYLHRTLDLVYSRYQEIDVRTRNSAFLHHPAGIRLCDYSGSNIYTYANPNKRNTNTDNQLNLSFSKNLLCLF